MKKTKMFVSYSALLKGTLSAILQPFLYLTIMTGMILLHMIAHIVGSLYGERKSQIILIKGLLVWNVIIILLIIFVKTIGVGGIAFLLMPKLVTPALIFVIILIGKLIGERLRKKVLDRIVYEYDHPRLSPVKTLWKKLELAALFLK